MTSLAKHIDQSDKPTQAIANTVLGLGHLAQQGVKLDKIENLNQNLNILLDSLAKHINQSDKPTQDIANTVLGLGPHPSPHFKQLQ